VRVVGTSFSVDWDAGSRFFAVNVRGGKVLVTGGELRAGGILLGAGERIERRGSTPENGEAAPDSSDSRAEAPPSGTEIPSARPLAPALPSAEDDFRAQATRGNYSAAITAARHAGFERLTHELPAIDLLLLANAARYAGSSSEARAALLKLRERFPRTPSAAHAAEQAARDYLRLNPNGPHVAQARVVLSASP
jgi:hypothetical protein